MNILRNIWNWVAGQVIGEVPEDDAPCEYDCRKLQCTEGEWETCERRLQRAAGELMPAKIPVLEVVEVATTMQKPTDEPIAESAPPRDVNRGD
jgi:hypothetical protein